MRRSEPGAACESLMLKVILAAGKYNERAFKALDYILDEASKVGVRLIMTMADNWSPVDSKTQVIFSLIHYLLASEHFFHQQSYCKITNIICNTLPVVDSATWLHAATSVWRDTTIPRSVKRREENLRRFSPLASCQLRALRSNSLS